MRIAVDAMGGDHAPEALVEGALLARPQCQADLTLIGHEARLHQLLGDSADASSIRVVHAPQIIGMGEEGPVAIRKKRDASLSVAMRLMADGEADAVVSAGNTAAIVATSRHFAGLVPGLRRPALAVSLPTTEGKVLLADAGAHAEADSVHLAQSAALAHVYLKVTEGLQRPRLGLLNLGQEPTKGTKAIQRAFAMLKRSRLHFVGNVEPYDILAGQADVAICGGFVGNLLLKMYEGLSETVLRLLEAQLPQEEDAGVRECLRQTFRRFQKVYHYENVGGAPLLGVLGTVIVAHGRSHGQAVASAIHLACRLAGEKVSERMQSELAEDSMLAELRHYNTIVVLENLKSRWGFHQK